MIGSGLRDSQLVSNVLGCERVAIHERAQHILEHAGMKMTKKEFFFLRNKATDLIENKETRWKRLGNKPTVCAPQSGSDSGTTSFRGNLSQGDIQIGHDTNMLKTIVFVSCRPKSEPNNPNFEHYAGKGWFDAARVGPVRPAVSHPHDTKHDERRCPGGERRLSYSEGPLPSVGASNCARGWTAS